MIESEFRYEWTEEGTAVITGCGGELTDDPMEADVIVTDNPDVSGREDAQIIRSCDNDRILALLNSGK